MKDPIAFFQDCKPDMIRREAANLGVQILRETSVKFDDGTSKPEFLMRFKGMTVKLTPRASDSVCASERTRGRFVRPYRCAVVSRT